MTCAAMRSSGCMLHPAIQSAESAQRSTVLGSQAQALEAKQHSSSCTPRASQPADRAQQRTFSAVTHSFCRQALLSAPCDQGRHSPHRLSATMVQLPLTPSSQSSATPTPGMVLCPMLVMFSQPRDDLRLQHGCRDCLCPGVVEGSPPGEAMAEPAPMAGECLHSLQPGPAVLCSAFDEQLCLTVAAGHLSLSSLGHLLLEHSFWCCRRGMQGYNSPAAGSNPLLNPQVCVVPPASAYIAAGSNSPAACAAPLLSARQYFTASHCSRSAAKPRRFLCR